MILTYTLSFVLSFILKLPQTFLSWLNSAEEKEPSQPAVPLEKQSLEDFYQTTHGYYPAKLPKYPSFRLKSAPSTMRQVAPNTPLVTSPVRLKSSSLVITTTEKDNDGKEGSRRDEPYLDLGLNL